LNEGLRVLVTGASGRIGAAVCAALADAGHDVHGLDSRPSPQAGIVADLLDAPALRRALAGIDAVVHVAALHAPHVGQQPDAEFLRVNVDGTRALLDAAAGAGVRRILFTSTTALYGAGQRAAEAALWVDEDTPPAPVTIYHRSKLTAEALLEEAAAQGGPTLRVLRMGRCFDEAPALMAVYRLQRGVDARDVADAHRLALQHTGPPSSRFVLAFPTPFRRDDAAGLGHDAAAVIARREPELAAAFAARGWTLPSRIDRVYDAGRAVAELGWRPRHGWRSVLQTASAG